MFSLEYADTREDIDSLANEFVRSFDLEIAPLFRVKMVKVSEKTYLLIDAHHIISDGLSMRILIREFAHLYNGNKLEPLELQYKDFAVWQNELLKSHNMKKQEEYWLNSFKDEVPILNLPIDYERPAMQSFEGNSVSFEGEHISKGISKLVKMSGATTQMVLLSTFNILLSKYSLQEDIVVGIPISGRNHAQLENVMGMFVNTLAVRNKPLRNIKYMDFLNAVKINALESYENQSYQLETLIDKLNLNRDTGRNPLFDVTFNMVDKESDENLQLEELSLKPYNSKDSISKFDVTLHSTNSRNGLYFTLEYAEKLFKKETIERMGQHYISILEIVINNPEIALSDIDILSSKERNLLVDEFNLTDKEYPKDKTLHQLFDYQVKNSPNNIAVVFEDAKLSYKELDEKANSLGRSLREKGIKPNSIVGIMLERSLDMIIAMLGVLKAGGAYLPIDPTYPRERIEYMFEDSESKILLSRKSIVKEKAFVGEFIDMSEEGLFDNDSSNLENINSSMDLAYVIYTSGTTGNPKGVVIKHQNIINTLCWRKDYYGFNEKDAVLQIPSFAFDSSVEDIFTPLISGSQLIIIDQEKRLDMNYLNKTIINNEVTHFLITPALYNTMLTEGLTDVKTLTKITVAGEHVNEGIVEKHFKLLKDVRLFNEYGPTENSVCSTVYEFTSNDKKVLIGKPISNTKLYIVDSCNNLLPIGVAGELCISGVGLSDGYLNKPELTKEKFVDNPFKIGSKMYRTGDLAKWLPDGNIEFLGRIDNQVKIRGYRIEVEEIENRLLEHEDIKEAVVIAKENENKEKYLCAYVVSEKSIEDLILRNYLRISMPEYMIPAYFVSLEKMPLTTNGKVDKRALPEPKVASNLNEYEAPRNIIEEKIIKVWSEVLGIEKLGINDNFFNMGGDSIKAIQVCSRLSNENITVSIKDVFQYPVIRELSENIILEENHIPQENVQGEVELTAIQRWFFHNDFIEKNHWNQALMLYSEDGFDKEIIEKVFSEISIHHDALRMVYKINDNKVVQYNKAPEENNVDLTIKDFSNREDYEADITKECTAIQGSINLQEGPLVKLGLFRTKKGDHLLIAIHHLIIDGVSWRILLEDFAIGYEKVMKGQELSLPKKTHSFKTWANEIVEYSKSSKLLQEIDYWKKIENTKVAFLPSYNLEFENVRNKVNTEELGLSKEYTDNLLKNVRTAYNTEINDILLAALGSAIKDWTGENNILISLEGHGREEIIKKINITRTVGWFTSTFPVILNCENHTDTGNFIKSIKDDIRRIPNRGIGYDILKYITPDENKHELEFKLNPQISFNYLGQTNTDIKEGSIKSSWISSGESISNKNHKLYDLNLCAIVVQDSLNIQIEYNSDSFDAETIRQLAQNFKFNLERIIDHCMGKEETEMTVSDFDDEKLSLEEFEKLQDQIFDTFDF